MASRVPANGELGLQAITATDSLGSSRPGTFVGYQSWSGRFGRSDERSWRVWYPVFCAAMAHAEHTVILARPIGEVFAFLADGMNEPKWRPEVINIAHVSGSGVGAVYAQTMKGPGGRSIAGDYRITRFDEPTRMDFEVIAGPARPTGSYVLRDTGIGSTEVTFTMDLKPRGLMVLMTPMINKQVKAEVANLDNLAAALTG
jgi:Polyketide cyclase / dehydrase and lipid transport